MNNNADNISKIDDYRPTPSKFSKRQLYGGLSAILTMAILLLSYKWYIYNETHLSTDNAYVENDLYPVNSRIMGYVRAVNIQENSKVKKGDVLAEFDDKDLNLELSYKKAKMEKAEIDFHRAETLIKTHTISEMEFENARANYNAQHTDYDATMLKIEFAKVLSPADGVIAKKNIQIGQFVQPGQSLFVVVPTTNAWVKANYKETQVGKIKPGMKAEIIADALPGHKFTGVVESISPSSGSKLSLLPPENATGNFTKIVQRFPVIIRLDGKSDDYLRTGMSVNSTILIEEK